jgi:hypothetical protein
MPMLGDWVRLDPKLGNLKPISVWKGSIYLNLPLLMYGITLDFILLTRSRIHEVGLGHK